MKLKSLNKLLVCISLYMLGYFVYTCILGLIERSRLHSGNKFEVQNDIKAEEGSVDLTKRGLVSSMEPADHNAENVHEPRYFYDDDVPGGAGGPPKTRWEDEDTDGVLQGGIAGKDAVSGRIVKQRNVTVQLYGRIVHKPDGTTQRHRARLLPYNLRTPAKQDQPQESLWTFNCSRGHHPTCLSSSPAIVTSPRMGCGAPGFRGDLVMIIPTVAQHIEERRVIRRSWAWMTQRSNRTLLVQHVFVYGHAGADAEVILEHENRVFGDVLQGDFEDTYRNLTLKTILAYRWFKDNCPRAKYLMKTDDDMFVNTLPLMAYLQQIGHDEHVMIGSCYAERKHKRFGTQYKWYMSREVYPDPILPAYCCGCGYIITAQTARDISDAMQWLPILPIEDLFTGLAITRLGYKVKILNNYGFARPFDMFNFPKQCKGLQQGRILSMHMVPTVFLRHLMNSCPINSTRMRGAALITNQVNTV